MKIILKKVNRIDSFLSALISRICVISGNDSTRTPCANAEAKAQAFGQSLWRRTIYYEGYDLLGYFSLRRHAKRGLRVSAHTAVKKHILPQEIHCNFEASRCQ